MNKYSDKEVFLWYKQYKILLSTRKVAQKFNVARPTVKRRFTALGLKIRENTRKYFFNEQFFNIDSPESFYWAGFIAADGCIGNKVTLAICLSNRDVAHLEKFKNALGYKGKTVINDQRPSRNSTSASIAVCSMKLVSSLVRFGIGPRKSLTYEIPESILNHRFINHFIRGYCDGDGCFTARKNVIGFNVRGSEKSLCSLRTTLHKFCGINKNVKVSFDSGIYRLAYSGRLNVMKIRNFLYKDSNNNMELTRKREIVFSDIIGNDTTPRNEMPVIATDLNGKFLKFYSTQSATRKDGFSPSKVCLCVSGERKKHKGTKFIRA